jgi:hypothetical protein
VRQPIVAVLVDYAKAHSLHMQGLSWPEVFDEFAGNSTLQLTREEASAWLEQGFAKWAGRGRLLIAARAEAFARLKDLSAKVGEYVATNRHTEWTRLYLQDQFVKGISI